jgi:hypothetical protein
VAGGMQHPVPLFQGVVQVSGDKALHGDSRLRP